MSANYNLIVAMCKNNGIGYKGTIPWHIKEDLQYFSKLTKGQAQAQQAQAQPRQQAKNAVIMGSNTWKSLPKGAMGLNGRDNLVLSKASQHFDIYANHEHLIKTFDSCEALERFIEKTSEYDEVWVIGGAQVYEQFLSSNKIKKCYVT
jgi:dihydrofolate reductase